MKKKKPEKNAGNFLQRLTKGLLFMNLGMLCMLVFSVQLSASPSYAEVKKLNLNVEEATVQEVITEIENQSEFVFFYNHDWLDQSQRKVNLDLENATIHTVLEQLFASQDVTYTIEDRDIILVLTKIEDTKEEKTEENIPELQVQQQEIEVSGTVTDAQSGEPLPGVNIVVQGTTTGTTTNMDGEYSIKVPADATLVFSFVGYQEVTVGIEGRQQIDVEMEQAVTELEEVVAVGYGEMSKERMSTSISKLDPETMEDMSSGNPADALQGSIPGLRVAQGSGQPGSVPSMVLRGGTEISGADPPLVIVDGTERHINDINPKNIESIHVLRDAASTAVYGSRASSGVILIETKEGNVGQSEIRYDYNIGVNAQRDDFDYANAEQFLHYQRLGAMRRKKQIAYGGQDAPHPDDLPYYGKTQPQWFDIRWVEDSPEDATVSRDQIQDYLNRGWQWMLDPIHGEEMYAYKDTILYKDHARELVDEVYNMNAQTQEHNLSFSGGNKRGKFFSSLNYYAEDGLIVDTYYKRFTGKISGSYNILDNLEGKGSFDASYREQPDNIVSNALYRARILWPTWDPWNDDGSPRAGPQTSASYGNPQFWKQVWHRKDNAQRSTAQMSLTWDVIPDLSVEARSSVYYVEGFNEFFQDRYEGETGVVNDARPASASTDRHLQQQHNLSINYSKSFGNHNVDFMTAGEYLDFESFRLSAAGRNAPMDAIKTLNSATEYTNIHSERSGYRILSSINRLNYNYDEKYLFTAVLRIDGSSRLSDHQWGQFPGLSVGWNMHREDFFAASPISNVLSSFKPRLSYGVNGDISGIGRYETQGQYGFQTRYNREASILNTRLINRGLKWERSVTLDGGVAFGLFNDRISGELTYFNRVNTDLLTNLDLPRYTGFGSFRTNLGDFQNRGFEANANIDIIRNEDGLNWNFGFNASYVKNEILRLPENDQENNRQGGYQIYDPDAGEVVWVGGYQEGEEVGDMVAYRALDVLRDRDHLEESIPNRVDEVLWSGTAYGPEIYEDIPEDERFNKFPIQPGDVLWDDIDGNDTINHLDQFVVGNSRPDWTGGFSTSISYGNFNFNAHFDYALGHTIYNHYLMATMGNIIGHMNFTEHVLDTWTEENKDAEYPAYSWGDYPMLNYKKGGYHYTNPNSHSSQMYEKGDYLCIRKVTLSYTLPETLAGRIGAGSVRINVTGQNLHYFTNSTVWNPEVGGSYGYGRYPTPRKVVLGVNFSF